MSFMNFFNAFGSHMHMSYFGFLVTSTMGFKARMGSALFTSVEVNVMYIPQDSPLVLHLPTS